MARQKKDKGIPATVVDEIIVRSSAGDSPEEIAKALGMTERVTGAILSQYIGWISTVSDTNLSKYRKAKNKLLEAAELEALKSIVRGLNDTENPPALGASALAFQAVHKTGRLERGQSTENVEQTLHVTVDLSEYRRKP